MMSLPNILTMSRIAAIPLIVGFLYLGTPAEHPDAPEIGDLSSHIREWAGPA